MTAPLNGPIGPAKVDPILSCVAIVLGILLLLAAVFKRGGRQ